MNIDKEINNTKEYLKYAINQIVEKNNFYYHSKVTFTSKKIYELGDILIKPKLNWKNGISKIFKETENYVFTRQFNGVLYTREQYFKNKIHNKNVTNGLYCN